MKVRVACHKKNEAEVIKAIEKGDVQISDQASYIIIEESRLPATFLTVKERGEYVRIPIKDILYIDSLEAEVYVHTLHQTLPIRDTLAHLELVLSEKGFLRTHKSYLVQVDKISRIRASMNTKFLLVMENHDTVEVSRTYYYRFKEVIGL